jgi:hypothetical protein
MKRLILELALAIVFLTFASVSFAGDLMDRITNFSPCDKYQLEGMIPDENDTSNDNITKITCGTAYLYAKTIDSNDPDSFDRARAFVNIPKILAELGLSNNYWIKRSFDIELQKNIDYFADYSKLYSGTLFFYKESITKKIIGIKNSTGELTFKIIK